jgi:endonuclease/exonuclease/phosphatase family metal-dependent hydrolase
MPGDLLTLCAYNVENLFVSLEYADASALARLDRMTEEEWRNLALPQFRKRQKPLAKTWGVAEAILDMAADVLMLSEVGGLDSIANFNRHFLGDRYEVHFVDGNSRRAIDLAFLVRKGLSLTAVAHSNRDLPVEVLTWEGKQVAKFSRDIAELRLHDARGLRLIVLLVHLKSMLTSEKDYRGRDTRTAEAAALAGHYQKLRADHPGKPIILGGDFNAGLESQELELFVRSTDLVDFHEVLATPPDDRVTYLYFEHDGTPRPETLDYLLISPDLRTRVDRARSFVYRYKGPYGVVEERPDTMQKRYQLPSDHYPQVLTLRL